MYPLNSASPWPRNQWYLAAFADELGADIIGRTILGEHVILLRAMDGTVRGLSGICPHRMMPLKKGKLADDQITCPYHGLSFALDGDCVSAPTVSRKPDCSLRTYPVVEVGPLIWIWPGDPKLAEATPLPNQQSIGIGTDGWHTDCVQRITLKARAQLLIDNLFDLSHLGFVHADIVGDGGVQLAMVEPKIEENDGRLRVSRTLLDAPLDPYNQFLFPDAGPRIANVIETDMVGISLLNAGSAAWDGPTPESSLLGNMNFIHGITPETEHSTHYWSILARDFRQDDQQLAAALRAQNIAVIQQDIDVLESIEKVIGEAPILPKELSIKTDAGALRARLRILQMIKAEGPSNVSTA